MAKMTIGIDFGGSSSKATLLREDGKVLGTATCEYKTYCPHVGWVEQNIQDLYNAMLTNIHSIISITKIDVKDISAIALDAATHIAVLCDENDEPLRPIIHWSDNRSTQQAARLKENFGQLLKENSVNSVSAAWTLPQLLWLNENEPEIMSKLKRVYFLKDYLRHKLTGDFCTDYIEAMGAMLGNDYNMSWSKELCDLVGLKIEQLPSIKSPLDIAGYMSKEAAEETGLYKGLPIIVGATDTCLEVYASGAIQTGSATVKLATAGRICPITTKEIPSRQFFNYKHIVPNLWYPGTGTRSCATSYKWFRDVFGDLEIKEGSEQNSDAYELIDEKAKVVAAGCDKLFFHPYLMGEMTPLYDDSLRSSFVGATMYHTKGHFARAVMEGVAYSLNDCLNEVKKQDINLNRYHIIGGGAKSPLWRQIVADILGEEMYYTRNNDSSLGSAMLAAVAIGIFNDFDESVAACIKIDEVIIPIKENMVLYKKGFQIYKEIQQSLMEIYHKFY